MTTNPLFPAFYSPSNQLLLSLALRDQDDLTARWHDEAAEAALSGNPRRAAYLERWAARLA